MISSIETKDEAKNSTNLPLLKEYKAKIESELDKICYEIIKIIDTKLLASAKGNP